MFFLYIKILTNIYFFKYGKCTQVLRWAERFSLFIHFFFIKPFQSCKKNVFHHFPIKFSFLFILSKVIKSANCYQNTLLLPLSLPLFFMFFFAFMTFRRQPCYTEKKLRPSGNAMIINTHIFQLNLALYRKLGPKHQRKRSLKNNKTMLVVSILGYYYKVE